MRLSGYPDIEEFLRTIREGLETCEVGAEDVRTATVCGRAHIDWREILDHEVNSAFLAEVSVNVVLIPACIRAGLRKDKASCTDTSKGHGQGANRL